MPILIATAGTDSVPGHPPGAALFRGLSIAERASMLPAVPPSAACRQAGTARYERWVGQHPFTTATLLARRLAGAGLDQARLRTLLAEDDTELASRCQEWPTWVTDLAAAGNASHDDPSLRLPASVLRRSDHPFLLAVAPLVAAAQRRLAAGVTRWAVEHDPGCASRDLADLLGEEMVHGALNQLVRTMVLELHVAKLEGQLHGSSGKDRFHSFAERYRSPSARSAFFEEYPVLGRLIADTLDRCVQTRLEFLQRASQDRRALATLLGAPLLLDRLAEVQTLGDVHRGGRAVLCVRCHSGRELIYKPRPLAAEAHFQRLLEWLNDRGWQPVFRTCRVLDRGDYGWMERLAPEPCASIDGVGRFYQRLGGYLALLHALGATDLHFENIIAAGEDPMLIDLETLFHPALTGVAPDVATDRAHRETADSVLSVGLLPEPVRLGAGASVDVSALGAATELISPEPQPCWVDSGTDAMRLERTVMTMPIGGHRPTLGASQQQVEFAGHAGDLLAGFDRMYDMLLAHRDDLLEPSGPIATFRSDTTRVVLRPTQSYHVLHREAEHPDLLRDALERDRHLDRLWARVATHPALEPAVACEHEDLWLGDIPLFTTRPDSRDLWCSRGHRIANYLPETGLDLAARRLTRMGPDDCRRQHWFIRTALGQSLAAAGGTSLAAVEQLRVPRPLRAGSALDHAVAIGDRLVDEALLADGHATWLGEVATPGGGTTIGPVGTDLYAGLSGITLFLATLGSITGNARHLDCARGACRSIRAQATARRGAAGIGGYSGWGGVIYALAHLSVLLDEPELAATAVQLAGTLDGEIDGDVQLDVISGAAGLLLALVSLHRVTGSAAVLTLARRCGDRLASTGHEIGDGTGWLTPGIGGRPLAGMSHGAAGIAQALLQLYGLTKERRYRATAIRAMRYERAIYDTHARQWPDLRGNPGAAPTYMNAWCHGAPGIGLARLETMHEVDDADVRAEITAAVAATLREGFGMNHSLCHGALGNLELPLVAARALQRADWARDVSRSAQRVMDDLQQRGPVCGSLEGMESPGLMTGLAGVGYGLLRLTHTGRVASVLTLSPPVAARKGRRLRR